MPHLPFGADAKQGERGQQGQRVCSGRLVVRAVTGYAPDRTGRKDEKQVEPGNDARAPRDR